MLCVVYSSAEDHTHDDENDRLQTGVVAFIAFYKKNYVNF